MGWSIDLINWGYFFQVVLEYIYEIKMVGAYKQNEKQNAIKYLQERNF